MGADIVINTAGVSVAADDRQGLSEFVADAAETILEELGHAYNYAAGSGGSSIVYDVPGVSSYKDPATGKTIDAGLHNYLTIMGNCNK